MIFIYVPRFLLPLILLSAWSMQALAGAGLENWRIEMVQVRGLAESNIPQAYAKAQRLQSDLPADATPADRVRLLNLLVRIELYRGESAAVDRYAEQALELAAKHDDRIGQAETDLLLSLNAVNQSQFDRMKAAIHHSMEMLAGSDRKDLLVEAMLRTSMMYLRFGLLDESTSMAMQTLEVAKHGNNPLALTYAHQGMAIVYDQSRNSGEAREHYRKMLGYAQDAHSKLLEADALLGLGSTLMDLGDLASGGRLVQDAVNIYRKAGGPFYTAHALNVLANLQHKRNQPTAALASLDEAVQIYEQRRNKIGLWWTLHTRSEVLETLNRVAQSQADAERGYKLAREMGVALYLGESARRLAVLAVKRGNYKQAYERFAEADEMSRKSEFEKTRKRIFELAQQFEEESKQLKIEELNRRAERQHAQQFQLLIMLAGAALLLAGMAFFLLRLRKSRAEIRTLNAELEQRVLERTAELFDSQESLAEAQRIAHVGSWKNNLLDNVLTWSEEVYRIFEIDPQQFGASYEAFMELVHPDDRGMLDNAFKASLENREPFEIEHRLLLPDGRIKYVHEHCETSYAADGKPLRSIGTVQDITERKHYEHELRRTLDFQQTLLKGIKDVGLQMIVLENGRVIHVNNLEFAAQMGYDVEAIAGQPNFLDIIHPDDMERVADNYFRRINGEPVPDINELSVVMADGSRREHEVAVSVIPGTDPVRMIAISRDITERKLTEQRLKEALEFSEGVINAIPDLLFEMNREGRYLNIWTHTPELLAAHNKKLLGNTVSEMLAPETAATVLEALREAESQGLSFGKVIHIELPQGTSWFELSVSKKPSGTFLMLSRDITGRKRMENDLRISEERMRLFFERQLIGAAITSPQKGWIQINDKVCEMLGYSREELVRLTWAELTYPDDLPADVAQFERLLSGEIEDYILEKRFVHKDGRIVFTNLAVGCVRQADRTVEYVIALLDDITERKCLEAELRDSRNFLDSVIDAVPDPVFVKDRKHRWVLLNKANCKFTGMSREVLIGKSDYDIFSKEQADVFWEKDELVFDSGEVNLNEESFTSADGEEHFIQTKKTPFVSADGSQMLVGVIRDITERKHYETAREAALAEAEHLAKMRSEFIAHMSHELRTPLNGILGYAQMLGRDGKLDEKQHASMEVIRQSGEHLLSLIEDILDLARIESGKLELEISDIPLAGFLNVVAGIIGVRAKQKQIEFVCEFAPDLPQGVRGDDKRLRQVLLNLLSNAIKFTDRGRVTLSVSRVSPSRLAFAIADTGIGIAASDRAAIFHSFEQVSDTQYRQGGTGLGLTISQQLVRLMGGDIVVESRSGGGSIFRFELELSNASIEPDVLCMPAVDMQQVETNGKIEAVKPLIAPQQEALQALHRLALLGNMRDIANYAEHIASLDPRYAPFSEHLKRLASSYQSKAILAFVEEYLI